MDVLDPKNFWPFSWIHEMLMKYRRWKTQRQIAKWKAGKTKKPPTKQYY